MRDECLERAQGARAHQRCEAAVQQPFRVSSLAVAVDRAGEEEPGKRGHERVAGVGREMGDASVDAH